MSVNEILEAIPSLTPEERAQVKALLDALPSSSAPRATEDELEDAFERELAAEGFISEAKPRITDFSPYRNYKPVEVSGQPVSEMIIEERR